MRHVEDALALCFPPDTARVLSGKYKWTLNDPQTRRKNDRLAATSGTAKTPQIATFGFLLSPLSTEQTLVGEGRRAAARKRKIQRWQTTCDSITEAREPDIFAP